MQLERLSSTFRRGKKFEAQDDTAPGSRLSRRKNRHSVKDQRLFGGFELNTFVMIQNIGRSETWIIPLGQMADTAGNGTWWYLEVEVDTLARCWIPPPG